MSRALLAEFDTPEALRDAVRALAAHGVAPLRAYSPYPVEALAALLPAPRAGIARAGLAAGIVGACIGLGMQYYASVVAYPLDIAGRPRADWAMFLPVAFELAVLFAAFAVVWRLLRALRLPRLTSTLLQCDAFARASTDRFFLLVCTDDARARQALFAHAAARSVREIQADACA